MLDQLIEMRYLKVIGGEYPVLRLTPQGEAAIRDKSVIPLKLPRKITDRAVELKKAERQAGGSVEYTSQLFTEGLNVEQVAVQRGLSPSTIYGHAANLIADGRLPVEAIVPDEARQKIEAAIQQVGTVEFLYPIKALLPDGIDYNIIRCVVAGWKCSQALKTEKIGQVSSNSLPEVPTASSSDPILAFLSRPHPRPLPGPWKAGWALDFHSQFTGAAWSRSATGDLAYRLKYQGDLSVLPALVEQAAVLIAEHPELREVDAILPVPPSTSRSHDPVSSFARSLAQRLGLPFLPALVKSRQTAPQKEMHTLAQKRVNVAGAFHLKSPIKTKRLLVIDDLFDSGATLEEIFRLLQRCGSAGVCVLTLTRTIHSDA